MEATERDLLAETLRKTMTGVTGPGLDAALAAFGWADLLTESPEDAVPLVFGLLGETGAYAPLLNDVVLAEAGRPLGGTLPLPFTGGNWVIWQRDAGEPLFGGRTGAEASDGERLGTEGSGSGMLDAELPLRLVAGGKPVPLAAGRRALGWWLVGLSRGMIGLARQHAVDRVQFGRPLASFQAVRHRLAEALVYTEGAEATLRAARDDLGSLLAKAAAGHAALTAARHCQQVLGGIGFTAEHDLHRLIRRALVLDGLLGSARELTLEAGALLRSRGTAPRLAHL